MNKPLLRCPKCQGESIICHGKRYALYPAGCVTILAVPLAWVHRESTPVDFECRACGHRFSIRTTSAKIAYVSLWAMLVFVVVWMATHIRL